MKSKMYRKMPVKEQLPYALYTAEQVRHLDRVAIEQYDMPGAQLMQRAGEVAFDALLKHWPEAKDITIVTGSGNNGGDGFVIAWLAKQAGMAVRVLQLGDSEKFSAETMLHAERFRKMSGDIQDFGQLPGKTDVIVDAILGTGLNSAVQGRWYAAIESINQHPSPVMSLDIPSGLNADTGCVMGIAIQADMTISFIGLKRGMFTGAARDYCGRIMFHALDVPARVYASEILSCRRIDWNKMKSMIPTRSRIAHKGHFGHVLLIGGNTGYSGAIRLAAEAAARSGAGLVTVATHPSHAAVLNVGRPELMVHPVSAAEDLSELIQRASVIVAGPGLGQVDWSRNLLEQVLQSSLPVVLDADALNMLADNSSLVMQRKAPLIITPHPGEAGRLLQVSVQQIEEDRFKAVEQLRQRFFATVVLKGAGTLVAGNDGKPVAVCSAGNPGMASGGMGDVLSGIIGAFVAQGLSAEDAAASGVALHAAAADRAAGQGEIGLLASDLFAPVRELLNA